MAVSDHIHHYGEGGMQQHYTSSSTYYVTFQVESGDRMEFVVPSREYGMLVEGDMGRLTFQEAGIKASENLKTDLNFCLKYILNREINMSIYYAKKLLNNSNNTCVAVKGNQVYESNLKGILPIITKLKENPLFFRRQM